MPKPIAEDVRARVIAAVSAGRSARQAAREAGVSVSSAVKWTQRWRQSGSFTAHPAHGHPRSPLHHETAWLLDLARTQPGITLATVQHRLRERGINIAISSIWRFYDRHDIRLRQNRSTATPPLKAT